MLEITYDGQPFDLSTISVDGTMVLRGRCTSVWTNHPEPDTGAIRYAQPYFDFAVTNKGEISEEEALSTEFEDKRAAVSTVMTSATMYNLMRQMKSDEMDRDYGSPYDLKYATHKDRNVAIAQQTEQGTRFYRASLKVGTDLEKCTVTSDRFQEMLDAGTVDVVADLDRKEWARF